MMHMVIVHRGETIWTTGGCLQAAGGTNFCCSEGLGRVQSNDGLVGKLGFMKFNGIDCGKEMQSKRSVVVLKGERSR